MEKEVKKGGFSCVFCGEFTDNDNFICDACEDEGTLQLNEYQELAMRTKGNLVGRELFLSGGLGIAGEAGEVADLVKKAFFHGHGVEAETIVKELGDVLWYIALIAHGLGIDLSYVASQNIEKLKKRYPDGFDCAKSINREV